MGNNIIYIISIIFGIILMILSAILTDLDCGLTKTCEILDLIGLACAFAPSILWWFSDDNL